MKSILKIMSYLGVFTLLGTSLFLLLVSNPSSNVELVSTTKQVINNDITATASIVSKHQYTLYSSISGVVKNLPNQGSSINKDQVLAVVKDNQEITTDSQSETRLRNLVKQYSLDIDQNTEELSRISNAVNAGVLPRFKLDEIRTNINTANAKRSASVNELNSYRSDKRKRAAQLNKEIQIKALSNGLLTKNYVYEGQWIRKGDPIFNIISTGDLEIKVMMSPQEVDKMYLGQSVLISKIDSDDNWEEKVVQITPIVSQDPNTKNLQEVVVSLTNPLIKLAINEKVKLKVKGAQANTHATSLPIEAVIREGKDFYVLHVDKNKKADLSDIYSKQGLLSTAQQFKCQLFDCNTSVYGLSKKLVQVGNSDLNRVHLTQDISSNLQIVLPNAGINKSSLVVLENNG